MSAGQGDDDDAFARLLKQVASAPPVSLGDHGDPALIGGSIGHFRIEAHVGSGGMGAVYLATDDRLHRKVALKLLPSALSEDAARRALLLREARTAAAVSHPNIAAIYEVGEHEGRPFIAMEYVDGSTLRDVLAKGPLAPRVAHAYALQIAQGLARAHRAGIVHRDLKPDNVMLDAEGTIKILDFGLARSEVDAGAARADARAPSGPASGEVPPMTGDVVGWSMSAGAAASGLSGAGTRAYMAPEHARRGQTGARADVYSFGVTVSEMLVGRPAKADEKLARRVPRRFRRVIERCLSGSPAARFADAGALEIELRRAAPWRGRDSAVVALALVLVLGAVAWAKSGASRSLAPHIEQVTFNSSEAPVHGVAMSRDGSQIAYVEARGLFLQDIATHHTRRLELTPKVAGFGGAIAWFPDGARLLVAGHTEAGRPDMWIVDAKTGATSAMGLGDWISMGAVAPDGQRIAVTEYKGSWEGAIALIDMTSRARTVLYESREEKFFAPPVWSPDGRRLAFIRGTKTGDDTQLHLDVLDVATGTRQTLVDSEALEQDTGDEAFDWLGDGRLLVALAPSVFEPARPGLVAIDATEDALAQLGSGRAELRPVAGFTGMKIAALSCDASGTRMAFVRNETQADVMAGTLSEGGERLDGVRRISLSDADEWSSDWSADSRDVLIVSDASHGYRAVALSSESSDTVPISDIGAQATWPVLGPGGQGVVFWQASSALSASTVFDLLWAEPGKPARKVFTMPTEVHVSGLGRPAPRRWAARCARGAASCFLARPDGDGATWLDALDLARGSRTPLARFAGRWQFGFAAADDASQIAVVAPNRTAIHVYGLDGSLQKRLEAGRATFRSATWLSRDALLVAGTAEEGIAGAIFRVTLDGAHRPLWSTLEGGVDGPSVSPDGRHAVFTMTAFHANVWLSTTP